MNVAVSAVLIIAFSIMIVGMVLQFGSPIIQEHRQELEFEQGKSLVNFLSITISDLLSEPISSSRELELEFRDGILKFSNHTLSFSSDYGIYNKTFEKINFNNLEIPYGKTNIKLTKTDKDEIKIEII